jgi:hypothetical protein
VPLVIVLSINKSGRAPPEISWTTLYFETENLEKRFARNKDRLSLYTTLVALLKEILQHIVVWRITTAASPSIFEEIT